VPVIFPSETTLNPLILKGLQADLLPEGASTSERTRTLEAMLGSPVGQWLRDEMGRRIVELLQVEYLVPLVRDAMFFMSSHLSAARLAPKLVEQMDLPANTPPEVRLLRLIAKVPGLQKLGQVLARNRHLRPSLRHALSELENGICDVNAKEVGAIIRDELGPKLAACGVEIEPVVYLEASVSALMRFTWWNPASRKRERGVFKVMKPYIPACFAEDLRLLGNLAKFLGSRHRKYAIASRGISDTFREVQQLLSHEVHFLKEQETLRKASRFYSSVPGVRVPQAIQSLCTSRITAMSEEHGKKVTDVTHLPAGRRLRLAEQLVEAFVAVPLSASNGNVMFHADPHAGNVLYDEKTGEIVILDWALTESLSRQQRRHLAMLFLMIALRDPVGACAEVQVLSRNGARSKRQAELIRSCVTHFIDQLPLTRIPGAVDAMRLVEQIAYAGVRFPAPLIMMRKVLFTLDGILHDIAGPSVGMEFVIVRRILQNWASKVANFGAPLQLRDWAWVQFSTLLYAARVWVHGAQRMLERPRPNRVPAV
jgi:ubiquinone biosynthesis protein